MELKSLIIGLVLSLGAFAVKSGAGLGYAMAGSQHRGRAFLILTGFAAGYAAVFFLAATILSMADLMAWYPEMETVFKGGMILHMILAGLLAVWGFKLMAGHHHPGEQSQPGLSKAWLALALPCPVCFLVILLNTGLVSALYPERPLILWWLFSGFILVSLGAAAVFHSVGRGRQAFLGGVMLYMAAYFVLCVTLIPQFGDFETIRRLSESNPAADPFAAALLAAGALFALAAGFFNPFQKRD